MLVKSIEIVALVAAFLITLSLASLSRCKESESPKGDPKFSMVINEIFSQDVSKMGGAKDFLELKAYVRKKEDCINLEEVLATQTNPKRDPKMDCKTGIVPLDNYKLIVFNGKPKTEKSFMEVIIHLNNQQTDDRGFFVVGRGYPDLEKKEGFLKLSDERVKIRASILGDSYEGDDYYDDNNIHEVTNRPKKVNLVLLYEPPGKIGLRQMDYLKINETQPNLELDSDIRNIIKQTMVDGLVIEQKKATGIPEV